MRGPHNPQKSLTGAVGGGRRRGGHGKDRLFGFQVPRSCPEVPDDVLEPSTSWGSKDEDWRRYDALAARYAENCKLFAAGCPPEVAAAGPRRLKDLG